MGKSFNDDVFNNNLNLDSINGLNISKEAIEENKKPKINIDISNINLEEVKEKVKEEKKNKQNNPQEELQELIQEQERYNERGKEQEEIEEYTIQEEKTLYTKKTMIFKQEYLDIIDGLATINDMQIKDVLNQLLEKAINELDEKTREKALKNGKKTKSVKATKNIF